MNIANQFADLFSPKHGPAAWMRIAESLGECTQPFRFIRWKAMYDLALRLLPQMMALKAGEARKVLRQMLLALLERRISMGPVEEREMDELWSMYCEKYWWVREIELGKDATLFERYSVNAPPTLWTISSVAFSGLSHYSEIPPCFLSAVPVPLVFIDGMAEIQTRWKEEWLSNNTLVEGISDSDLEFARHLLCRRDSGRLNLLDECLYVGRLSTPQVPYARRVLPIEDLDDKIYSVAEWAEIAAGRLAAGQRLRVRGRTKILEAGDAVTYSGIDFVVLPSNLGEVIGKLKKR